MNARAHDMRIDGFPILWFDNDADRQRAHVSPEMAACNVDSRLFIGAVSRVICEPRVVLPQADEAARMKLIALLPGEAADDAALERYAAGRGACLGLPAWCCIACCNRGRHRTAPSRICRSARPGLPNWHSPAWSIWNARCRRRYRCGAFRGRGAPSGVTMSAVATSSTRASSSTSHPSEQGRTFIVTGLHRSGTSLVASILQQAGLFIGSEINDVVYEDEEIARVLLSRDIEALRRSSARRNAVIHAGASSTRCCGRHSTASQLRLFDDPRLIITFRDPVSMAVRTSLSEYQEPMRALRDVAHGPGRR